MGDSGALVLGFTLASISVAGLLKTASTVVLFLPLLVLAVPIIDTSFVVLKRLKYRQPISTADRSHLHHRFINIGFAPAARGADDVGVDGDARGRGARDAVHPVPRGRRWHPWETVAVAAIALGALAFSVYIVYLLEIVKLGNPRVRAARGEQPEDRRSA